MIASKIIIKRHKETSLSLCLLKYSWFTSIISVVHQWHSNRYIYISILLQIIFPHRFSQTTMKSPLCYTIIFNIAYNYKGFHLFKYKFGLVKWVSVFGGAAYVNLYTRKLLLSHYWFYNILSFYAKEL